MAEAAWRVIDGRTMPITIRMTDAREMRALNTRFRQKRKATDVLTFPYADHDGVQGGDIVIGIDHAIRQARARRVSVLEECARLIVHGLAHVIGYHHASRTAFAAMRTVEFETLIRVLPH